LAKAKKHQWDPTTATKAQSRVFYAAVLRAWIRKYGYLLYTGLTEEEVLDSKRENLSGLTLEYRQFVERKRDKAKNILRTVRVSVYCIKSHFYFLQKFGNWYRYVLKTKRRDPSLLPFVLEVIKAIKFVVQRTRSIPAYRRYGQMFVDKLADDLEAAKDAAPPGIGKTNAGEEFLRVAWANETAEVRKLVTETMLKEKLEDEARLTTVFNELSGESAWVR
jgi:hypothetical protein